MVPVLLLFPVTAVFYSYAITAQAKIVSLLPKLTEHCSKGNLNIQMPSEVGLELIVNNKSVHDMKTFSTIKSKK